VVKRLAALQVIRRCLPLERTDLPATDAMGIIAAIREWLANT
jgi:hypothetical protein